MEAVRSSETLASYRNTTQHHNTENLDLKNVNIYSIHTQKLIAILINSKLLQSSSFPTVKYMLMNLPPQLPPHLTKGKELPFTCHGDKHCFQECNYSLPLSITVQTENRHYRNLYINPSSDL